MRSWTLVLAALLGLSAWIVGPGGSNAAHVAANQCGVQSSSFARTCRPGAHKSCLGAVERGVKGFSKELCEKRKAACAKCLGGIHTCIGRIGHWPELTHTCETCKTRFDNCYDTHYPK